MQFTLIQLAIATTCFIVFYGTLLNTDLFGAACLTISVLLVSLLGTNVLQSQKRPRTGSGSGILLAIFSLAWLATLVVARSQTIEYVDRGVRTRNTSTVELAKIYYDPYRTEVRFMLQHKSPWVYVGNSWTPFPFITSVEYGVMNEYDAGAGGRLYFLVSPLSHYELRSVFLWARN